MSDVIEAMAKEHFKRNDWEMVKRHYGHLVDEYRKNAQRLIAEAAAVGWKLVPVEPDIAMTKAAIDADDKRTGAETCKHLYRAMIAASPEVM